MPAAKPEDMRWRKPSQELVELFEAVLPDPSVAQRKKMFGMPASFANGNMFAGLFQDELFVRLPAEEREALLAMPGAHHLEPVPGHVMGEYICVPPSLLEASRPVGTLQGLVAKAYAYAATLQGRAPKPRRSLQSKSKGNAG